MECSQCMYTMVPKTFGVRVMWTCPVCGYSEVTNE